MSKSTIILSEIRVQKIRKQAEFHIDADERGQDPDEFSTFEPCTDIEAFAWEVGYLRGLEAAENLAAEILYPTIDTDD